MCSPCGSSRWASNFLVERESVASVRRNNPTLSDTPSYTQRRFAYVTSRPSWRWRLAEIADINRTLRNLRRKATIPFDELLMSWRHSLSARPYIITGYHSYPMAGRNHSHPQRVVKMPNDQPAANPKEALSFVRIAIVNFYSDIRLLPGLCDSDGVATRFILMSLWVSQTNEVVLISWSCRLIINARLLRKGPGLWENGGSLKSNAVLNTIHFAINHLNMHWTNCLLIHKTFAGVFMTWWGSHDAGVRMLRQHIESHLMFYWNYCDGVGKRPRSLKPWNRLNDAVIVYRAVVL